MRCGLVVIVSLLVKESDEMVVNCDSSLLVIACGDCECP